MTTYKKGSEEWGDEKYDEMMQAHLDNAVENIIEEEGTFSKYFGLPSKKFYITTDKRTFESKHQALDHQYDIERGVS